MSDETLLTVRPEELAPREAYNLLLSTVVPRPIAWISTLSPEGRANLAPYSFFNGVCGAPPVVMFAATRRRDGQEKHSLRNARTTSELVVNLVSEELTAAMNLTAGEWPEECDEAELAGLATTPSLEVRPPRLAAARAALEVRVQQLVEVEGTNCVMVLGRVLRFHFRAAALRPGYLLDATKLQPVARLGGDEYGTLGRVFSLARPEVPPTR